ncbi:FAD/NAD(P)-binding domain-containing protein [Daldinia eschscholtzii]|nr:FAD/NAD(P)-binding domain-containing protein [Daldinia eschscholtzii]
MEECDFAVIGAGFQGLAVAKQLHCTQPDRSLIILDGQSSLGGKWAKDMIFPGLKSNNLLGTYEYPDFPMSTDRFGVKPGQHIPAEVIYTYLEAYAEEFGIKKFIRLETRVVTAEHQDTEDGGWILTIKKWNQQETARIFAHKLVVATGLLSEPFMPKFNGQEQFGGKIFHSKDFPKNMDTLKAKSVTVLGAGKAGWDAVYQYASAGVKVNWVIRSSGHGPVWMAPPYVTPFKRWIEKLANTRCLTWFSPCIWGDADGYWAIRYFYHRTAIGRFLVDRFWDTLSQDVITLNKLDSHPDTAKLKPWLPVMFSGCTYSILNYEQDFFELVKSDRVSIHIGEIAKLSPGKVHLADGTEFQSEVFLANTGWTHAPPMKFLPEGIEKELGVPHEIAGNAPEHDLANNHTFLERADKESLERFPRLRIQPVWNKNFVPFTEQKGIRADEKSRTPLTPYMLYRFLIPASPRFLRPRDVAFIGCQTNFSNITTAHLTGLWVSAYFSGKLTRDPAKAVDDIHELKKLQYETVLHNRFGKWRHPTEWGNKGPNFIFDAVPYFDLLQKDLGLNPFRKENALKEMYEPYGPEDYRYINEEWLRKQALPKDTDELSD